MDLEYVRPLPPELLVEMHKCLPLANQIYVLVNVSKTFVINNSTRMHRNIQRLKTSLNEYIGTLVDGQNNREKLIIYKEIEWKPELDALFRYGSWLTSTREFRISWNRKIVGMPENFLEELILHFANSSSPQMTLHLVHLKFGELSIPTFIKLFFNEKEQHQIGQRIVFESVQLETENGQILHIYDGQLKQHRNGNYELKLFVKNKMDGKNLFQILIDMDSSKNIRQLQFSQRKMQSIDDIANFINENSWNKDKFKQNGDKLEVEDHISWNYNLDFFLRHGAAFSQFRHFKIKGHNFLYYHPSDYADFLINSMASTKHPEDFLESVEKMGMHRGRSPLMHRIWKICDKGISEGGKFFKFEGKKLQILSGKTEQLNEWNYKLEFTLANGPTNGAYLFDVEVQFRKEGRKKVIDGIKIQKRKVGGDIVELKCDEQIGLGKKRKASNDNDGEEDEDEPTCSAKLMKQ